MLFSKTPKREIFDPYREQKPWFNQPRKKNTTPHITLFLVGLLCFLLGVLLSPVARADAGELLMQNDDGSSSQALLLHTDIKLSVNGMIAHVTYKQVFTNNSDTWKHAIYTFPLNEKAAVNDMEMVIGERVIRGHIKPRAEAKKAYESALKAGKKASLTEQQRPNLFTQRIANIAPNESVTITLKYIQEVSYRDGEFSFHLPTTLTPRYIPGSVLQQVSLNELEASELKESESMSALSSGWAMPTIEVPDADQITPFMFDADNARNTHHLSFNASLDIGIPIERIDSRYHDITRQDNAGVTTISLRNNQTRTNQDILLLWRVAPAVTPRAAAFTERFEDSDYAMVMLMPPQVSASAQHDFARDVTFVIDTSGSMGGRPIEDAKSSLLMAIERLDAKDKFNVIAFNSNYSLLFQRAQPADLQHKRYASGFVSRLSANGGTEMAGALKEALNAPSDENYLRQVVFITDGAVGNEASLFAQIKQDLGSARLFTVGIGSAPNSYFMTRAAQFGKGSYVFVGDSDDIQYEMQRLFHKLESPVLRNLTLTLPPHLQQSAEIFPKRVPDLYAAEPLLINLKAVQDAPRNVPLSGEITLSGNIKGNDGNTYPWSRAISIPPITTSKTEHKGVATAWARKKVAALMDEKMLGRDEALVKKDILNVALPHKLITAYTSFVAIEERISRPKNHTATSEVLKNAMPEGMQMRAVSFPQTAA
ncbi:marine proteobacterial sortase target protein [Alteromonas gracilis]|uniref:marine proteobacterial sortase target protein n=1 Tax=Alteromonas gracilis TaxID=1479524 RepID=UPI00321BF533